MYQAVRDAFYDFNVPFEGVCSDRRYNHLAKNLI
jgi:hypothetical protein